MLERSALLPVLTHFRAEPSRTWSIIVTLYGDAVAPRGGSLWLGTLLEVFAALGIGGNAVRTAMSRLAADGWLERNRVGRNSFYRLAAKGRTMFAEAATRIYGRHGPAWDGCFQVAVLADPGREVAGYVPLAPGIFVSARPAEAPKDAILLRAIADADNGRRLAAQAWPLARTEAGYRRFLQAFGPLAAVLANGEELTGLDALVARVLMIHEYRRVVLRDPLLPAALLPEEWPGHDARRLCSALYQRLLPNSEAWLEANALNEEGHLPPPDASFHDRFRD
jgi:phenylacetic acid degradation operon negative regulatory protein